MRIVRWVGGTKDDLAAVPPFVRSSFGHRLWDIQCGMTPPDMKPLPEFGNGVYELRESFDTNAYRLVYIVKLKQAIYVLHVFMKKSKTGIGLPKPDMERIKARLKAAQRMDEEE